jgi:hypothetical protein
MPQTTLDKPLTMRDIINSLCYLPDLLRDCDKGEEAENLDCLIERIKFDLIHQA